MTDTKTRIEQLVATKPRNYGAMIKRDPELSTWVTENSLIVSDHYAAMVYSALHQESNTCPNGGIKTLISINEGWAGCGPAKTCKCTRDSISASVITAKASITAEEQEKTNTKRVETMISKYGHAYNAERPEVKASLTKPKVTDDVHARIIDRDWLNNEYTVKLRTLVDIAKELGVNYTTVSDHCKQLGISVRGRGPNSSV